MEVLHLEVPVKMGVLFVKLCVVHISFLHHLKC